MLYFVHSTTTEAQMELENNPAFVELSSHPMSQAFFSAAALRMKEEGSKGGFQKIMAMMNELIHDNHSQLQKIRKINAATQGECIIVTHKLKDRQTFFQGQTKYFKRRGSVTISEKSEAVGIQNDRNAQNKSFGALLVAATARYGRKMKKWNSRCSNTQKALDKVNVAIRTVTEWKPKSSSFIQQTIKETAELYKKIKKMPLTVPEELIQLGASDKKIRKRLNQWLLALKAAILDNLAHCQRSRGGVHRLFTKYKDTVTSLRKLLTHDSKKLGKAIENFTMLIKVYSENERIYSNLASQNNLLVQANAKYCSTELSNFQAGEKAMEAQLNTLVKLRFWLRKNFHKVKRWIKRRYAKVQ
jgi:menaquinone-dependent protoporphyrinogen IX oxidase